MTFFFFYTLQTRIKQVKWNSSMLRPAVQTWDVYSHYLTSFHYFHSLLMIPHIFTNTISKGPLIKLWKACHTHFMLCCHLPKLSNHLAAAWETAIFPLICPTVLHTMLLQSLLANNTESRTLSQWGICLPPELKCWPTWWVTIYSTVGVYGKEQKLCCASFGDRCVLAFSKEELQ